MAAGLRRPRDYAIFYRTNALSRALERALTSVSVPYQIVRGLEFYQRKEIKDILAYLHLLNNPASDVAFLRVINTPPRRIGTTTIAHIKRHAAQRRICLLDAAREAGLIESLAKRTAVEVAKFMAMYDRLRLVGDETGGGSDRERAAPHRLPRVARRRPRPKKISSASRIWTNC